jgi:hypothetical protein
MVGLLVAYMITPAIAVAARLRIADLVAAAPKTADDLARETNTHADSLRRLLRFLTAVGVFEEDSNGAYRQTSLSATLCSASPASLRDFAVLCGSEFNWRPWGDLGRTIATGQPAFDRVHGAGIGDYLIAHPDHAEIVNAAMTSFSSVELAEILAAYDFSRFDRIVDVGGGHGSVLHGILSASPRSRGVLADRPSVVAGAVTLRSGPIAQRCDLAGVDFLEEVPAGADAYLAKSVIRGWSDEDAVRILKNCRRAIREDGTMLLIERIVNPSNEYDPVKFVDMAMLVLAPGGRERSEADFRALLDEAGFSLTRVIPTGGALSIIESRPAALPLADRPRVRAQRPRAA